MKKYLWILGLLAGSIYPCLGNAADPVVQAFFQDLKKAAANQALSEQEAFKLANTYSGFLLPHNEVSRLENFLERNPVEPFPMASFKDGEWYQQHIQLLFNSANPNHRFLAYLMLASADDNHFNQELLVRLKTEEKKMNRIWAGMALLYLKDEHIDELFEFLVRDCENDELSATLGLFIKLDPKLLSETALKKIGSQDKKTRILAAAVLGELGYTKQAEICLKKAVQEWPLPIKGYAINALKKIMAGDLLELLKPLLDEPQTRATALSALANSPTPADNAYFKSLIPVNGEIPIDILKAMENSGNQTTLKLWLGLLQNAAIPENYHFYARHNVLLCSEAFKSQVIEALKNIKNPKIAAQLMPALDKQTDVKRGSYPGRNKNQ